MTLEKRRLEAAIEDARRGHRIAEYEHVAEELADAAEDYLNRTTGKALPMMQAEVVEYCEEKGWKGPDAPAKTFGDCMAMLHSEVSEAVEAYRTWGTKDATSKFGEYCPACVRSGVGACDEAPHLPKPEGVGSEFADILIRLLDDCDRYGIDLQAEYERKMAYNRTRTFQHGGKRL